MKFRMSLLVISFYAVLVMFGLGYAQTSYTVNSSNDVDDGVCDGVHCSLREAIDEANTSASTDTIKFDIQPYGTFHTIQPNTELPYITQPVYIKGYTQENARVARANAPARIMIALDGGGTIYSAFKISADDCVIRGLTVKNFSETGMVLWGDNNRIEGNYIGTDVSGMFAEGNRTGVGITGSNNIIGDSNVKARNIISGNSSSGVSITSDDSFGNIIQGNYIGANADASGVLANDGSGVLVWWGHDNQIGGSGEGEGNLIWGNTSGIHIANGTGSTGNIIMGNLIGIDESGNDRGNSLDGVLCYGVETQIGGPGEGQGNTIAFNSRDGVSVNGDAEKNFIVGNSIFSNDELGIDLNFDDVSINDISDGDSGPNELQNYPDLFTADFDGTNLTVAGLLDSKPNTLFDLHFYSNSECDPSAYGEGEKYKLVETNVANGIFSFTWYAPNTNVGKSVTVTATDPFNNTSEFSNCQQIVMAAPKLFTGELQASKPETFALHQNYPNPFNPSTSIRFEVPERSDVSIKIYNVTGQLIRTLAERSYSAGQHEISWDGKNVAGKVVSSGTYVVKLVSGSFIQTRKMVLLR